MISPQLKLYLLATEILPILDNLPIEKIKVKRSAQFLVNYLEDYCRDANGALESNPESSKHHEDMVLKFGKIMDEL